MFIPSPIGKQLVVLSILDVVFEHVGVKAVLQHVCKPMPEAEELGSPEVRSWGLVQ